MSEVGLAPFMRRDMSLAGFVLQGRWPEALREWVHVLALAARLAAVPGVLPRSEIFRATEDLPSEPQPGTVGLIVDQGPAVAAALSRERIAPPPALFVLHPPGQVTASAGYDDTASAVMLLPGLPALGLDHQAIWLEIERDGTLARLVTSSHVAPYDDPDVAVLASLIAA
jgi:hypothetical protein